MDGASVPLTIGSAPDPLKVFLSRGSALHCTLRSQDPTGAGVNWPAGASLSLQLEFGSACSRTWPFTITGPLAQLTVSAADLATLPTYPVNAHLWLDYADGNGPFLWCSGQAVWNA
jgi:hypothetical protein